MASTQQQQASTAAQQKAAADAAAEALAQRRAESQAKVAQYEKFYAGTSNTDNALKQQAEAQFKEQKIADTSKAAGLPAPSEGERYIDIPTRSNTIVRVPESQWTPQMKAQAAESGTVYGTRFSGYETYNPPSKVSAGDVLATPEGAKISGFISVQQQKEFEAAGVARVRIPAENIKIMRQLEQTYGQEYEKMRVSGEIRPDLDAKIARIEQYGMMSQFDVKEFARASERVEKGGVLSFMSIEPSRFVSDIGGLAVAAFQDITPVSKEQEQERRQGKFAMGEHFSKLVYDIKQERAAEHVANIKAGYHSHMISGGALSSLVLGDPSKALVEIIGQLWKSPVHQPQLKSAGVELGTIAALAGFPAIGPAIGVVSVAAGAKELKENIGGVVAGDPRAVFHTLMGGAAIVLGTAGTFLELESATGAYARFKDPLADYTVKNAKVKALSQEDLLYSESKQRGTSLKPGEAGLIEELEYYKGGKKAFTVRKVSAGATEVAYKTSDRAAGDILKDLSVAEKGMFARAETAGADITGGHATGTRKLVLSVEDIQIIPETGFELPGSVSKALNAAKGTKRSFVIFGEADMVQASRMYGGVDILKTTKTSGIESVLKDLESSGRVVESSETVSAGRGATLHDMVAGTEKKTKFIASGRSGVDIYEDTGKSFTLGKKPLLSIERDFSASMSDANVLAKGTRTDVPGTAFRPVVEEAGTVAGMPAYVVKPPTRITTRGFVDVTSFSKDVSGASGGKSFTKISILDEPSLKIRNPSAGAGAGAIMDDDFWMVSELRTSSAAKVSAISYLAESGMMAIEKIPSAIVPVTRTGAGVSPLVATGVVSAHDIKSQAYQASDFGMISEVKSQRSRPSVMSLPSENLFSRVGKLTSTEAGSGVVSVAQQIAGLSDAGLNAEPSARASTPSMPRVLALTGRERAGAGIRQTERDFITGRTIGTRTAEPSLAELAGLGKAKPQPQAMQDFDRLVSLQEPGTRVTRRESDFIMGQTGKPVMRGFRREGEFVQQNYKMPGLMAETKQEQKSRQKQAGRREVAGIYGNAMKMAFGGQETMQKSKNGFMQLFGLSLGSVSARAQKQEQKQMQRTRQMMSYPAPFSVPSSPISTRPIQPVKDIFPGLILPSSSETSGRPSRGRKERRGYSETVHAGDVFKLVGMKERGRKSGRGNGLREAGII